MALFDTKKTKSDYEHLRTSSFAGVPPAEPPIKPHPLPKLVYPNTPEAEAEERRKRRARKAKTAKAKPTTTKTAPVNVHVTVQVQK